MAAHCRPRRHGADTGQESVSPSLLTLLTAASGAHAVDLPSARDQCRRRRPQPSGDSPIEADRLTSGKVAPWSIQVGELLHQ